MKATSTGITTIMLPERMDSETASSVEQTLQAALTRDAKLIVDGTFPVDPAARLAGRTAC